MSRTSVQVVATPGRPVDVVVDGDTVDLRPKERTVVAALALRHPETITIDLLITMVWPTGQPSTAQQSVHNHLARIRKVVPDLVQSVRTGYRLGTDVDIVVEPPPDGAVDADDVLVEFAEVAAMRPALTAFARRHRRADRADPVDLLRRGDIAVVGADARVAIADDPLDERAWWTLAAAVALGDGPSAAGEVIGSARAALLEVGLEPGRRLLDLERTILDGEVSADALLLDPFGSDTNPRLGDVEADIETPLDAIRPLLGSEGRSIVTVAGPDGFVRRELLARLAAEARARGFATVTARWQHGEIGPPTIHSTHLGGRPVLFVLDGAEHCSDADSLAAATARDAGEPLISVLTASEDRPGTSAVEERLDGDGSAARLRVTTPLAPCPLDHIAPPTTSTVRRLVSVLALLGEPVRPDAIDTLVGADTSAAVLHGARSGLLRSDVATGLVDLTSPHVGGDVLATIEPAERMALVEGLVDLDAGHGDDARRATRRSAFALAAFGPADPVTLDATHDAARIRSTGGDFTGAAATLERTADLHESSHGRTAEWCGLMIEAGRHRLAGGDSTGNEILRDVIDVAASAGATDAAAAATLEWCRLGVSAGAGSVDEERLGIIDRQLAQANDPRERAQLGAAASMVLSLADRPGALREHFEDALTQARSSGDARVLADVLPLAYMSIPLHDDVDDRLAAGNRLVDLGGRLGRNDAIWEGLQLIYSSQLMVGDDSFRGTYRQMEDVAVHDRGRSWEMHFIRSNIALVEGRVDDARRLIDDSLVFASDIHEERVSAVFGAHHLAAALADGTTASFLDPVSDLAREQPGVGAWQAALALCAAAAGDVSTAEDAARRTIGDAVPNLRRDPTYSAGLLALGEAVAILGDDALAARCLALLEPLSGCWSWCGSCTFGPIDLTRARLALVAGRHREAADIAIAAIQDCAELRAPRFADAATEVLLATLEHR